MRNCAVLTVVAALLAGTPALAHEYKASSILIVHPWAKATLAGARTSIGYLTIVNRGKAADRLLKIEGKFASSISVHRMVMEGDVAKMGHVEGIEVKPGETFKLKDHGIHLMFEGLRAPLMEEELLDATLQFEHAGKIKIEFYVQSATAPEAAHEHGPTPEGQ
jgi:copper(I)-binding protein